MPCIEYIRLTCAPLDMARREKASVAVEPIGQNSAYHD